MGLLLDGIVGVRERLRVRQMGGAFYVKMLAGFPDNVS